MRELIFVVGPNKSGKTTYQNQLIKSYPDEFSRIISTTTRDPREGEVNGVDYHFTSVSKFKDLMKKGEFFQYVEFGGNYYGTQLCEYEREGTGVFVCTPQGIIDTYNSIMDFIKQGKGPFDISEGGDITPKMSVVFFNVSDSLLKSRGVDDRSRRGKDLRVEMKEIRGLVETLKIPIYEIGDDMLTGALPGRLRPTNQCKCAA